MIKGEYMPVGTAPKTLSVSVNFDAKKAAGFLAPLCDNLKISGQKILLRFNSETKNVTINAVNDQKNVVSMIEYDKSLFEGVDFSSDVAFGIYDLTEFYNSCRIFDGGFDFKIENSEATALYEGKEYVCRGTDPDLIKEGPKALKGQINWVGEFKWNAEKFKSFTRALGVLKHDYVLIEGKKGAKELVIAVTDKDVRSSSYKETILLEDPLVNGVKLYMNKVNFVPIVTGSVPELTIQLSDKLVSLFGSTEFHKVKYYVSPCADSK